MPLTRVQIVTDPRVLSPEAERLAVDADARIDAFIHRRRDDPLPAFVPSDFRLSYAALVAIREQRLAPDTTFCEWGSGFGVTACMASQLGFDACGIEIERDLVDEARELAAAHDLTTEFVHGSFIPEGGDGLAAVSGEFETLSVGYESAYEELGLDPSDFGVIYAYPWPGEEYIIERIFEAYAATGALLVTYRGIDDIHIHRKVAKKGTRRR